jgi:hypothetical protein
MFKYLKISQCNSWYQQTNGEKLWTLCNGWKIPNLQNSVSVYLLK